MIGLLLISGASIVAGFTFGWVKGYEACEDADTIAKRKFINMFRYVRGEN